MGLTFNRDYRIKRPKANGSPGFIDVKKGHTPEEYGLDPSVLTGLLTVDVVVPDGLGAALDLASCIAGMMETDPEQKRAELWTDDLKPRVRVIEGVIKHDITEAERDEAWKSFKSEVRDDG